jgi:MFS family permease
VPALLISASAFAWYYLNEARVYSLQLGLALALAGSSTVMVSSALAGAPGRNWWRCFLTSLFLLCGTSPLGAVWGVFFFAAVLFLIPRRRWRELWRLAPVAGGVCVAGLAGLAAYYAWTLTLPARPTAGTTNAQTVLFVFYELLGLSGWGPGRNDLRSAGVGALKPFVVFLAPFAMLAGVVGWNGFRELCSRFTLRRVLWVMALAGAPLLLICALGVATHFRVLGRHAMPLLPLLLLGLAFGIVRLMRLKHGRWMAGLFLVGCLGSSLLIRFAPRHEKDDYRSAAARAQSAAESGQQVWWNAEKFGASYYHIADQPRIALVINATKESLQTQPEPDLIVASRPESYDNTGAVAVYVKERDYRLVETRPPFVFWARRGR